MRILCADGSPVSRIGISETISKFGYDTVSEASNYAELKHQLSKLPFDLIISEVRFSDAELLDVVEEVREIAPQTNILIYTFYANPTYAARAAAYQLHDFVLKRGDINLLIQSISSLKNGSLPPESLLLKAKRFLSTPIRGIPGSEVLTKREIQVLSHLTLGLSNREISLVLKIGLETVKEHVQNVLRKLQSADRTVAAVWALRNGIPTLDFDN